MLKTGKTRALGEKVGLFGISLKPAPRQLKIFEHSQHRHIIFGANETRDFQRSAFRNPVAVVFAMIVDAFNETLSASGLKDVKFIPAGGADADVLFDSCHIFGRGDLLKKSKMKKFVIPRLYSKSIEPFSTSLSFGKAIFCTYFL